MRHRHLTATLLLLIPAFAVAERDLGSTPQLLLNPGFERGSGDSAADWGLWPPAGSEPGVSSQRDAAVKHSGDYSGRLRVTRDDFKGICTFHHPAVPVQAGQELVLSFWMKAEGVVDRCGIDVQLRQGPSNIVGSSRTDEYKGTFDWKQVVHHFVAPEGCDHVCVVPFLYGKGTAWFDDVLLYATPSMAPTKVTVPPRIDGDMSDACWSADKALGGFALADGSGLPERDTKVWAAYDSSYLYFAFRCEKKPGDRLKKTVTARDGPVWTDDDVELFLNLQGDRGAYYQFAVNPLGTRYDSHGTDPGWSVSWKAVARDLPDAWTVEMAIPLSELPIDLTTGQRWCANFGRSDSVGKQASSWSCAFGGFHSPGRFGSLTGLDLDLATFYAKDARARIATVEQAYQAAVGGLDPASAPPAIAAPVTERQPRIAAALAKLRGLLQSPQTATMADWTQVQPQVAALTGDIANLQAASMRLRAYTLWRKGPADQPEFGLATASPMVKVLKSGADFGGQVEKTLSLSAARNEYESRQVVVVSFSDADIPDCRAEVTPLIGPGGAKIAAANLKLSIVGYVKTAKPGYQTTFVGDWPDPLMPNAPFALKAMELQPVWLRAYVPPGTPAGDYRGQVTITGGGQHLEMPVTLHVYNFDLPRRQHIATPFGCSPDTISQWYTGSADYQANMPPEVYDRWNKFMLDYRLTPTHVAGAYIKHTTNAAGKTVTDFSITDRLIANIADRLPPDGVAMAEIGEVGWNATNGSRYATVEGGAHAGKAAGRFTWPKTDTWESAERSIDGALIAERGCKAFRFWVKALDPSYANETMVAFVNAFPSRWVTTWQVGGTDWHEVRIPVEQYHNNTTGEPLTLAALKTVSNFQFVTSKRDHEIAFLVDDVVAECEKGDVLIEDFEPERRIAELRDSLGVTLKHWKDRGWFGLGHVYGKDEVAPDQYDAVVSLYRAALAAVPDAPIMQTYYVNRTPKELIGTVKIWCAITSIYDEAFLRARQKAGEKVWLYVCCGPQPPFANFFIDQPGSDHRVLFWQAWQKDASGLLYWETNYWHGMMPLKPGDKRWPEVPWEQEKVATYNEFKVNGDGFLIYPGPDWTPLPSVRLENIRDGIEDYEYLWLLRERDPKNKLLAVGDDISKDFTHYTKDPQVIEKRRAAIAEAIEAAGKRGR